MEFNSENMKKHLLSLITVVLLFSCSSDDDSAPTAPPPVVTDFLKVTIAGTEYTFDRFFIETAAVAPEGYIDLIVEATISTDASKKIIFKLEKDVPGTETIYYFYYKNGLDEYDTGENMASFSTNVTKNSDYKLIGTFSGIIAMEGAENLQLTNGSFDITY